MEKTQKKHPIIKYLIYAAINVFIICYILFSCVQINNDSEVLIAELEEENNNRVETQRNWVEGLDIDRSICEFTLYNPNQTDIINARNNVCSIDTQGRPYMAVNNVKSIDLKLNTQDYHGVPFNYSKYSNIKYKEQPAYSADYLIPKELCGKASNDNAISYTAYSYINGFKPVINAAVNYLKKASDNEIIIKSVANYEKDEDIIPSTISISLFSVNDSGNTVCLCTTIDNYIPGYNIDYSTGVITEIVK